MIDSGQLTNLLKVPQNLCGGAFLYTNMVTPDAPPMNASLSSLTTISNLWSTKQHFSSDTTHFLNKLDQLGHLHSNAILATLRTH